MSSAFWDGINTQLTELESATTADDVIRILSRERNPLGDEVVDGTADGFFAGSGGDGTVRESLRTAGWTTTWAAASYYWVMEAPDGTKVTYIEGDIYRGDRHTG